MIKLNELKNIIIEGIDYEDYPELSDAYVSQAFWKISGIELTEDECNDINESDINNYIHSNNEEMRSYIVE